MSLQNPYKRAEACRHATQAASHAIEKVQVNRCSEGHGRSAAHLVEHSLWAHNPKVGGSNPPPATT